MPAQHVLVVGGAGYIGSHCAHALEERGLEVVVFDDLSTGHRKAVRSELIVGDIRDPQALQAALCSHPFDAVMLFAAKSLVGESVTKPELYFEVNVEGTRRVVEAMVDAGVQHLVFSSSCSVYGEVRYTPVDEAHPTGPLSPYGASKLAAEQLLSDAAQAHGLRVAALRYFNAAGALPEAGLGESHTPETHLIPLALDAVLGKRPPLRVFGRDYDTPDGTCIRDYIHVMDLAEAHHAALEALWAGSPGGTWNLGTGSGASVLEVLQAVEAVTGRPVPALDAARREGDPPAVWASAAAAQRDLGWTARYLEIEQIVESAWRWAKAPRF